MIKHTASGPSLPAGLRLRAAEPVYVCTCFDACLSRPSAASAFRLSLSSLQTPSRSARNALSLSLVIVLVLRLASSSEQALSLIPSRRLSRPVVQHTTYLPRISPGPGPRHERRPCEPSTQPATHPTNIKARFPSLDILQRIRSNISLINPLHPRTRLRPTGICSR